jgi:hypothetical protein
MNLIKFISLLYKHSYMILLNMSSNQNILYTIDYSASNLLEMMNSHSKIIWYF